MTTTANGRAERKSLAGQLDRLDKILDGLADGLNEAVAAAVKQAVTAAVEAALVEVLTSAELQRRLRPEASTKKGIVRRAASVLCQGLVNVAKGCWSYSATLIGCCRAKTVQAVSLVSEGRTVLLERVRRGMTAFARQVWLGWFVAAGLVRRFRKPLLVAAAAGTALGVVCYLAGPTVPSLVCYLAGPTVPSLVNGVAGFLAALAAGSLGRLRRVLHRAAVREWGVSCIP
jgi:phage tail tape-measure protein